MKVSRIIVVAGGGALLSSFVFFAAGQTPAAEGLPGAPSSVKQEQKPAAAPSAAQSATASATQTPAASTTTPPSTPDKPAKTDPGAPSNPDTSGTVETTTTIRVPVNEVNVVFTVTDKHGRYVRDLKKTDFSVIDDSRPATEIRSFHSETDLPLQVGLLIDASNSVRDRFKFEQESAIEFLNQTVRRRYDSAFVVGFDVTPEVTQDFTDNTEELSRGVRALRPGGGTAMYDALYFACRDKLLKQPHSGPVRRAIVLLSDGDDNTSHVTREEAIEMAQRAEVIVYTISTNVMGGHQRGDRVLERIADATGGRPFFPFQLNDVANAFAEIQDELRSQYALSYRPADLRSDGRYHTVEILAQDHKNLRVRSRHGYYAPTQ